MSTDLRLYSRRYTDDVATDVIAPEHIALHGRLGRWGSWARRRSTGRSLASVEGLYSRGGGSPASTAPLGADLETVEMELAVIRVPDVRQRTTVIRLYVFSLAPHTICVRMLRLKPAQWPAWIHGCREAVLSNLTIPSDTGVA
jgi:hypothetical protein